MDTGSLGHKLKMSSVLKLCWEEMQQEKQHTTGFFLVFKFLVLS